MSRFWRMQAWLIHNLAFFMLKASFIWVHSRYALCLWRRSAGPKRLWLQAGMDSKVAGRRGDGERKSSYVSGGLLLFSYRSRPFALLLRMGAEKLLRKPGLGRGTWLRRLNNWQENRGFIKIRILHRKNHGNILHFAVRFGRIVSW